MTRSKEKRKEKGEKKKLTGLVLEFLEPFSEITAASDWAVAEALSVKRVADFDSHFKL